MDLRPIAMVIGVLLAILGLFMTVPVLADLSGDNSRDASVFLLSAMLTVFVGLGLYITNRQSNRQLSLKQAFLMTASLWVLLPLFSAIPFMFSDLNMGLTDAYFEAMSGLTTTGATVLSGLDAMPPGILIWRAMLQWLGGLGIIVMAVAILPLLGIGGMQLFRVESFDTTGNIIPNARQLSFAMLRLYLILTIICAFFMMWAGMTPFDAVAHSMTTVATGGYSTHDLSLGFFDSVPVEVVTTLFMILGSLPFVLYLQVVRGRPTSLFADSQVRTFLTTLAVIILMVAIWLVGFKGFAPNDALRDSAFNVTSIMTGTGYSSTDYGAWGSFAIAAFFFIMLIGGCAGSTSCGIKVFRFQVLFSVLKTRLKEINKPHGVFPIFYNGRALSDSIVGSVMTFLFLFFVSFVVLAALLTMTGLDAVTAITGASSALANVGPGMGDIIGPAGHYGSLPATAKWLLSAGMVVGRLELLTFLVLLTPSFWRQ